MQSVLFVVIFGGVAVFITFMGAYSLLHQDFLWTIQKGRNEARGISATKPGHWPTTNRLYSMIIIIAGLFLLFSVVSVFPH